MIPERDDRYFPQHRFGSDRTGAGGSICLRLAVFEKLEPTPVPLQPPAPYPPSIDNGSGNFRGIYYVREGDAR